MLLRPEELREIADIFERQADLDPELKSACVGRFEVGNYSDAVRNAFVVLESRLQKLAGIRTKGARQLIQAAFHEESGKLAKAMTDDVGERVALRELYSGAFGVFRNRAMHHQVDYSIGECRAILLFINLLLKMLPSPPIVGPGEGWSEPTFLAKAEQSNEPTVFATIQELLRFAKAEAYEVSWGRGRQFGSFTFKIRVGETLVSVYTIWTNGSVNLRLSDISGKLSDEILRNFVRRLKEVRGFATMSEEFAKEPGYSIARTLRNPGDLVRFKESVMMLKRQAAELL
jgi:uncharacterized protein (TIGR02391 family)